MRLIRAQKYCGARDGFCFCSENFHKHAVGIKLKAIVLMLKLSLTLTRKVYVSKRYEYL